MEVKAPLRTIERASLGSFNVRKSREKKNGGCNEHGRERQQSEKTRCNAQSCKIEKTTQKTITEIRDQSREDNDDESEQARRC